MVYGNFIILEIILRSIVLPKKSVIRFGRSIISMIIKRNRLMPEMGAHLVVPVWVKNTVTQ